MQPGCQKEHEIPQDVRAALSVSSAMITDKDGSVRITDEEARIFDDQTQVVYEYVISEGENDPKFLSVCKQCRRPFGMHSLIGDYCPSVGKEKRFDKTSYFVKDEALSAIFKAVYVLKHGTFKLDIYADDTDKI